MNFLINHSFGTWKGIQLATVSKLQTISIIVLTVILVSCDYNDTKLRICNNREEDLYIIDYTDSSLVDFQNALNAPYYKVEANKCKNYDSPNRTWEAEVEMSKYKKLFIYVIKAEDLDSLGIRSKEFLDKKGKYERYSY